MFKFVLAAIVAVGFSFSAMADNHETDADMDAPEMTEETPVAPTKATKKAKKMAKKAKKATKKEMTEEHSDTDAH